MRVKWRYVIIGAVCVAAADRWLNLGIRHAVEEAWIPHGRVV